jgi:hypothetical protein
MSNKDKRGLKEYDPEYWERPQQARQTRDKFLKLPESQYRNHNQSWRDQRFKMGQNEYKMDFRPRKFFNIMKVEIIILTFGLAFAISNHFILL